ncbi:hypothetical protein evm_014523 [Chilo suppressalis]|nr:hypothetical protein evm_014523 [Chilo suppressalis]
MEGWFENLYLLLKNGVVSVNDQLCQACLMLVKREAANHDEDASHHSEREIGHSCVCVCCGVSLSTQSGRGRHRLPSRSVAPNLYREPNISYILFLQKLEYAMLVG